MVTPRTITLDGSHSTAGKSAEDRYLTIIDGKDIFLRHNEFYFFSRLVLQADFNHGWLVGELLYPDPALINKYAYRLRHWLYCESPMLKGWPVVQYSQRTIRIPGLVRLHDCESIEVEVNPHVMNFDDARVSQDVYNWLSRHDRSVQEQFGRAALRAFEHMEDEYVTGIKAKSDNIT